MGVLRDKVLPALRYVAVNFGPLIAFWGLDYLVSLKAAIAGTVVVVVIDAGWRIVRRLPIPKLFVVTSGLTLVFGGIDLYAKSPFMLSWEAVITNVLTGAFFFYGALGKVPLIQELAEQQSGESFAARPDYTLFFRGFTLAWAGYFFLKSGIYAWMAATLPLERAMAIRSVAGTASMVAMVVLSGFFGPRLFDLGKRRGWLPAVAEDGEEAPQA